MYAIILFFPPLNYFACMFPFFFFYLPEICPSRPPSNTATLTLARLRGRRQRWELIHIFLISGAMQYWSETLPYTLHYHLPYSDCGTAQLSALCMGAVVGLWGDGGVTPCDKSMWQCATRLLGFLCTTGSSLWGLGEMRARAVLAMTGKATLSWVTNGCG